jgi:chitinase
VLASSVTTPTATVSSSTPYTGTPIALPATFEAEDFDKGGQGVAYHDLTPGNAGGQYRTLEDVDIIVSKDRAGGGYVVNDFQTGEWLAYTVDVPATGRYDLAIRASSAHRKGTPAFRIEVDGVDLTGPVAVPLTRNWNTFEWVGKQGIELAAGKRVIRLVAVSEYFNVNQLRVLASTLTSAAMPVEPSP